MTASRPGDDDSATEAFSLIPPPLRLHIKVAARETSMLLSMIPGCDETSVKTSVPAEVSNVEIAKVLIRPSEVSTNQAPSRLPGIPLAVYSTSERTGEGA